MTPRGKWGRLLLVAAAALVLIAFAVPGGRKYRGRTLVQWLQPTRLDRYGPDTEKYYQTNSVLAFQEAGRDGITLLLHELACRHGRWNWRIFAASDCLSERRWLPIHRPLIFQWPGQRVHHAARILAQIKIPADCTQLVTSDLVAAEQALNSLGTNAPSVWVSNYSARASLHERLGATAAALATSGDAGVEAVKTALSRTTDREWTYPFVNALRSRGTNATAAVPALVPLASDSNCFPWVVEALIDIRGEAALPVLLRAATNGHVGAIAALGEYGPAAKQCLPRLFALTVNIDPEVSFQAEIAMRKIRGTP